ncbi:hypothetical protein HMPREF1584_00630 [Gardnerella vaginalis JCP8481A]|nr:hypothetical protein HMPREF1585_00581 [Gardnerella vaginalis JCP8481B]EPI43222.1 hypothetical protein HMPREF1584_00630 [Gardnerella vaginalis JCP8481A]
MQVTSSDTYVTSSFTQITSSAAQVPFVLRKFYKTCCRKS